MASPRGGKDDRYANRPSPKAAAPNGQYQNVQQYAAAQMMGARPPRPELYMGTPKSSYQ